MQQRKDYRVLAVVAGTAAVATGVIIATRTPKRIKSPGNEIVAQISFQHRGKGERVTVGFGIGRNTALGHDDVFEWFQTITTVEVRDDPGEKYVNYGPFEVLGTWTTAVPGEYDALIFIQEVGGVLKEGRFIEERWLKTGWEVKAE